nr:MAG TPA: hypothetical protein [Caudoviricetes sp.]
MHPSASARLSLLYSIKKNTLSDDFFVSIVVTLSRINLA